jgi:hypothetical protein
MTASEIRKALQAAPFQPFALITGDGGRYEVPTPDHIAISPSGRIAAVFHDDDSASHLDVFLVTALHYLPKSRRKRG